MRQEFEDAFQRQASCHELVLANVRQEHVESIRQKVRWPSEQLV